MTEACNQCTVRVQKVPAEVVIRKGTYFRKESQEYLPYEQRVQIYRDGKGRRWEWGLCPDCLLQRQRDGYAKRLRAGKKRKR